MTQLDGEGAWLEPTAYLRPLCLTAGLYKSGLVFLLRLGSPTLELGEVGAGPTSEQQSMRPRVIGEMRPGGIGHLVLGGEASYVSISRSQAERPKPSISCR